MSETLPTSSQTESQRAEPVDVQIIGGGLGGLIAANLALDAGLSVRLIEKQRSVGGRATSSDHEGFTLNQGPHALYLSGELRSVLGSLGIVPTGSPPTLKGALGSIADRTDVLPQGPLSMLKTSLLPAKAKRQLAVLMVRLPKLDTGPLNSVTVADWLDDVTDEPRLRSLLSGLINLATYNPAADLASAGAAVEQLKMALGDGVIYVSGGWATIVDQLEARLRPAAESGRLTRVSGAVTAVTSDTTGTEFPLQVAHTPEAIYPAANTLIAVGSPGLCDRLLGGAGLEAVAGPPVQASVMDVGLAGPPPVGVHLGLDTGLYLASHSVADDMAPTGQSLVSLARYIRPGGERSVEETKRILLAHAERVGVVESAITMTRYLHKLTVTWGMPLASSGGLAGRPKPSVAGHPGVYVSGDWVGDTGLLADATAASAAESIRAIVADSSRRATAMVAT
jgi:phytoene dehydrogenase-like protein